MDILVRNPEVQPETEERLSVGQNGKLTGTYPWHKKVPTGMPFTFVTIETPEEKAAEEAREREVKQALLEGRTLTPPPFQRRVVPGCQGYYQFASATAFGRPLFRIVGVCRDGKAAYALLPLDAVETKRIKRMLKNLKELYVRVIVIDPLPSRALVK